MAIKIKRASGDAVRARRDDLVELLRDAVDNGAAVNFVAPLATDIAVDFWDKAAASVDRNEKIVLVAVEEEKVSNILTNTVL